MGMALFQQTHSQDMLKPKNKLSSLTKLPDPFIKTADDIDIRFHGQTRFSRNYGWVERPEVAEQG